MDLSRNIGQMRSLYSKSGTETYNFECSTLLGLYKFVVDEPGCLDNTLDKGNDNNMFPYKKYGMFFGWKDTDGGFPIAIVKKHKETTPFSKSYTLLEYYLMQGEDASEQDSGVSNLANSLKQIYLEQKNQEALGTLTILLAVHICHVLAIQVEL